MDAALFRGTADDKVIAVFHPRIWLFLLEAILKGLSEKAVAVEKAIAGYGVVLSDSGIEEAGGKASEAAVAERGIMLGFEDIAQLVIGCLGRGLGIVNKTQVGEVIEQRASLQEFRREVVLLARFRVGSTGALPIIGNLLHDGTGEARPELTVGSAVRAHARGRADMGGNSGFESRMPWLAHFQP